MGTLPSKNMAFAKRPRQIAASPVFRSSRRWGNWFWVLFEGIKQCHP